MPRCTAVAGWDGDLSPRPGRDGRNRRKLKMLKVFLMRVIVMEIGGRQLQSLPLISSGCGLSQG